MNAETATPVSILIAALGGEGGGVLSNWLVESAMAAGFPVQSTSIPGVAQRTGATTYYLEIFPVPIDELGDREPVLPLTPGPGEIDLMIASELLEAGRAMQNGFISPDRTTLIASTHRLYSVAEKPLPPPDVTRPLRSSTPRNRWPEHACSGITGNCRKRPEASSTPSCSGRSPPAKNCPSARNYWNRPSVNPESQ